MTELSKQAQDKVTELRKEYISSLPDKIKQIDLNWAKVIQNPNNDENRKAFASLCHKYAGSAGAYGLLEFSNALLGLEAACKECIDADESPQQEVARSQLEARYSALKNCAESGLKV